MFANTINIPLPIIKLAFGAIVLFEAATPSAIFVSVLASRYENEAELVSSVVLATTVMSVAVIPALLYYLT